MNVADICAGTGLVGDFQTYWLLESILHVMNSRLIDGESK